MPERSTANVAEVASPPRTAWLETVSEALAWRQWLQAVRRQFTVGRVVVLLTLLLLGGTGWWTWSTYRYRSAVATLVASLPPGEEALAEGNIEQALPHLRQAGQAGKIVGPADLTARKAAQLDREAGIWWRLAPTRFEDFLVEHGKSQPQQLADAFAQSFANRTMVFDGRLTSRTVTTDAAVDAKVPPPPQIEYQFDWVWLDEAGRQIELDLGPCAALAQLDCSEGRRVLIGAEIDRLVSDPGSGTQWKMRVKPETVTLLTAIGPLRQLHWPDEESYRPILNEQGGLLEINE